MAADQRCHGGVWLAGKEKQQRWSENTVVGEKKAVTVVSCEYEEGRVSERGSVRQASTQLICQTSLPREEIIRVLAESGIASVSKADLETPTRSGFSISNVYQQLLIHMACLQDNNGLVEFTDLDHQHDYPDLHVDSVRIMNLCRNMRKLMDDLGCKKEKFTLKDLVKPDPKRTLLFLSALINFSLHRDTKMVLMEPVMEELTVLVEQRQELEDRILQLNAEISEINESRERERAFVQEVEVKIEELKPTIKSLNEHRRSLNNIVIKKRDASKKMDEQISGAEFALVQAAQENASLRSKIVQSPDKLQRALEEKKTVQIEAKNSERAAMQSFHEKAAVLELYSKASRKMNKHLKQMQTLQEQVNSAKQVEKDVKVLKAKNGDDGLLDKSLEVKLFEHQGTVNQLEELLKQLEKERDVKCEEASKELKNEKLQVEYNKCGLEQRQREIEALVAEEAAMNEKINKDKGLAATKQQMLLSICEEINKE
ncbi:kinetochore protein NUF2 homolog, partial [Bidens hawaiensis]|uniref:kinetochore protein NUF2 homolog n=1 Tax=Bidens hawaiensis TaxID=980011 RepID=UPI00404A4850